jgi:lipoprotein-releasing system permease protein
LLFIFSLIVLVAAANIISLAFMHLVHKQGDIAILKAMGCSDSTVQQIFMRLHLSIAALAAGVGTLMACCAGWLLNRYPFITLPDAYYYAHLPVIVEWQLAVAVFMVVVLVSLLASLIPLATIKKMSIVHLLHNI